MFDIAQFDLFLQLKRYSYFYRLDRMLSKNILQRLVSFRRELHTFPEISFNEFQTRERIKKILVQFGVKENQWLEMAKTALVVDLVGQAPEEGQKRCIAFRADMDALSMTQTNQNLQYRSKNQGAAHMCGHDGHMTCLLGFVPIFLNVLPKIPKNKTIRLLFQPSQQGPISGAQLMIKEGCLEGVDEVYGFHNWPTAPAGQLWCKQGPVMSQITIVGITVTGTGGHGSQPQTLKVAIWQAMDLYQKIRNYLSELKLQKKQAFVSTFPIFRSGERYNVIAQSAFMQGTIRSFQHGLKDVIVGKIKSFIQQTESRGFKVKLDYNTNAPVNCNTKQQAEHVLRVGAKVYGKQKVGHGKLPFKASEDFSFFTQVKPGAFFFLSSARTEQKQAFLHNNNFDFNDSIIEKAAQFWYELALDRLKVKME